MKGLIIKDILNLKKNMRMTLLIGLFFLVFAYGTGNPPYLIGMATLLFAVMSVTSLSYDEMTKWDRYALAMPISRKDVVISKYLLATMLAFLAVVVSSGIAYLFVLPKSELSFIELLLVAYAVFFVALTYISFMMPFIYKFGVEKTRAITVGLFALPTAAIIVLVKAGMKMPSAEQLMMMLKLSPLLLLIILGASLFISLKIYKNKEL